MIKPSFLELWWSWSISFSIHVVFVPCLFLKFQIVRNSDLYLAFYGSLWNCQREYALVKLCQPLVSASWNDLKTCVTYWPNLGWCSTSLTKTEAKTALLTSDFHYKPPVYPNVHSGWDKKDLMGQLHHLGRDVPAPLESCEQWCSHRCSLLIWLWKAAAAFSFSALLVSIRYLRAAITNACQYFPLLSSSCHGPKQCGTVWAAPCEPSV